MNATTILCILLLSLYLLLAMFWIVRSVIDTIDDRKREKRNAAWEAERQQLEKDMPMKTLSIDIKTYSDIPLQKAGVYRYCESLNFEILLFGYIIDSGPVQVVGLTSGENNPKDRLPRWRMLPSSSGPSMRPSKGAHQILLPALSPHKGQWPAYKEPALPCTGQVGAVQALQCPRCGGRDGNPAEALQVSGSTAGLGEICVR